MEIILCINELLKKQNGRKTVYFLPFSSNRKKALLSLNQAEIFSMSGSVLSLDSFSNIISTMSHGVNIPTFLVYLWAIL